MPQPKASRPNMTGYGIQDADSGKGLLQWSWAVERLTKAHAYWVATVRPDGRPHVMPVWGIWRDDEFLFSTGPKSRKARNLAANPACVVSVEAGGDSVIVEGVAVQVTDKQLVKEFAKAYGPKYDWDTEELLEPVFRVRPSAAFAFTENGDFDETATRWTFETE